jgi:hypothetical protein
MEPNTRRIFLLLSLLCVTACTGVPRGTIAPSFESNINSGPVPWTHDRFDADEDKFTFAIISDLTGGERETIFEVAAKQLTLLRPELILSVGDLIEGYSEDTALLTTEWDDFDARAMNAAAPLFRAGGNHDLTGEATRSVWAQRYGPLYYHFIYKNVLFLVLDTEDYSDERRREFVRAGNECLAARARGEDFENMECARMPERFTGNVGPEQSAYFTRVLAEHPEVRWTMLFMHKPVWRDDGDPEFIAIESALSNRPYTVFNGHFHTMSHRIKNGRDYMMLGTTGGGQNDSDEMSFDHITLVTVSDGSPSIAHIRLDGILDKTGRVPNNGEPLCFQASACGPER